MEQELKDFKAILSVMEISDEKKEKIFENSKIFFEFQDFIMKKNDISKEAAEKMGSIYIQTKLANDDEALEKVGEGDMSPMYTYMEEFAKEQGFDKPLVESAKVMMEILIDIKNKRHGEED